MAAAKLWLCLAAIPAVWVHLPFPYTRTAPGGLGAARATPGDRREKGPFLMSPPSSCCLLIHLSSPPPNKQDMLDCCNNPLL